jgi:ERCC4-type nuclease
MIINVDYREKNLLKKLEGLKEKNNFNKITIKNSNLPLGDVIILNDKEEEQLIIERKSVSDLAASIKDGRYAEQSFRLNNYKMHNHKIVYIIEGDLQKWDSTKGRYTKIKAKTLYVTMHCLQYYKGFSVVKVNNTVETAEYIIRATDKMSRDKKKSYYDTSMNNVTNIKDYCEVVNKVKKKNIKPENIGEIILSQIPGISSKTSLTIMEKFGSLYNLLGELKKDPKCLNGIMIKTSNGSRKISTASIRNISQYLLYQKSNVIKIDT